MGWMTESGEVNEDAYEDYLASTNLVHVFENSPIATMCERWSDIASKDPNQFFADMDVGDEDEDDEMDRKRGGRLSLIHI